MSIERLQETKPPKITSQWLKPWLSLSTKPDETPTLRQSVSGKDLINAGTHIDVGINTDDENSKLLVINSDELVNLSNYSKRDTVVSLHEEYIKTKWNPWASEEKKRRKTIRLYSELFTLKQQLEGSIIEAQIEPVWGGGLGIWKTAETTVRYPLISQLVELSSDDDTAALEIRPRRVNPRIELDWYATQNNFGVAGLEKVAKNFFEGLPSTFSPFDSSTYEPLLRSAVTHLDVNGVYWPSQTQPDDRTLPSAADKLKVTDTWVLFARPRSNNAYLQDLEQFIVAVEKLENIPFAVAAIITEPDNENPEIEFPVFRGVSASYHSNGSDTRTSPPSHKARDLYFPKHFNDEQVRIIQFLNHFDGVVVQGPPGTGKTHTIANIICHYLAKGKRVLVTSMKDSALGVLTDKLPDEIKPLTIALLTQEQEGLKNFERSIHKIAFEVQNIDRTATSKQIQHLEELIDTLHGRLAYVDWDISAWAKKNLKKIVIDSIELDPVDAAKELTDNQGVFEWIPDSINITEIFNPKFNDQDIRELRSARSELGSDLIYLDASLP